jgi:hypothetical protein
MLGSDSPIALALRDLVPALAKTILDALRGGSGPLSRLSTMLKMHAVQIYGRWKAAVQARQAGVCDPRPNRYMPSPDPPQCGALQANEWIQAAQGSFVPKTASMQFFV